MSKIKVHFVGENEKVKPFAGLRELFRSFAGTSESNDEQVKLNDNEFKLVSNAHKMSEKRIADLERSISEEISTKSEKNPGIVPTVETSKSTSNTKNKTKEKEKTEKERE